MLQFLDIKAIIGLTDFRLSHNRASNPREPNNLQVVPHTLQALLYDVRTGISFGRRVEGVHCRLDV